MSLFVANLGALAKPAGGYVFDADAQAYLDAESIVDATITAATHTAVGSIKAASLWTKYRVIYPGLGSLVRNLKDPRDLDAAFRGTIHGTVTQDANGFTGNGSDGYIDTHFNQSTDGAEDDEHISCYSRSDVTNSTMRSIGLESPANQGTRLILRRTGDDMVGMSQSSATTAQASADSLGYFSVNRTSSTGFRVRRSGTNYDITQASDIAPINGNFYFMARNLTGTGAGQFSSHNFAWFAIGRGLTEAEDATMYGIVQAYQAALGRSV